MGTRLGGGGGSLKTIVFCERVGELSERSVIAGSLSSFINTQLIYEGMSENLHATSKNIHTK